MARLPPPRALASMSINTPPDSGSVFFERSPMQTFIVYMVFGHAIGVALALVVLRLMGKA